MRKTKYLLSPREIEVVRTICAGTTRYEQIARRLCITPKTVQTHIANIYTQMGIAAMVDLVIVAIYDHELRPICFEGKDAMSDKTDMAYLKSLPSPDMAAMPEVLATVQRYQEQLTAIDDGGTVNRASGVDPFPGVVVAEGKPTAFDIAEGIVKLFGVAFAREVAAEVQRWGEWK